MFGWNISFMRMRLAFYLQSKKKWKLSNSNLSNCKKVSIAINASKLLVNNSNSDSHLTPKSIASCLWAMCKNIEKLCFTDNLKDYLPTGLPASHFWNLTPAISLFAASALKASFRACRVTRAATLEYWM